MMLPTPLTCACVRLCVCAMSRSPLLDAWEYANSEKDRIEKLYQQWAAKQTS